MQLRSGEYHGRGGRAATVLGLAAAVLLSPAIGASAAHAAGKQDAAEVAYVEQVSGRVVAFTDGKPTLLDALDLIADRTRLDLQANSELRLCHYPTLQLLTLKGPLRASISHNGVTTESKAAVTATGSCVAPVVSTFQGGLVSRGAGVKTLNVSLQPNIRVVNRSSHPIRKIALWDGEAKNVLLTFDRNAARPTLDEGRSYLLVVERGDGSEVKTMLQPSAATKADPLILVVR
jgi:hypothetical protein